MDLRDMAKVIRKRAWMIVMVTVISSFVAGAVSSWLISPTYEASTKLIVNQTAEEGPAVNWDTVTVNLQLIATYKELIQTAAVMDEVISRHPELGLTASELADRITVESVNETQVITIIAQDDAYDQAALIVNSVSAAFKSKVVEIMEVDNVTILNEAPADESPSPVAPNVILNIVIAFVLSALLSIAIAFLLKHLDDKIYDEADVREALGLPVLAVIHEMEKKDYTKHKAAKAARKAGDNVYVATN